MFKKIEIWILYLTILIGILFAIGFGILVRQELAGNIKLGNISKAALFIAEIPSKLKYEIIGLKVPNRFEDIPGGFNGDTNEEELYLLLSRYNGDIGQSIIELIDLRTFDVLHSWNPDMDDINSKTIKTEEFKYLSRDKHDDRAQFVHPFLQDNGNLLFHSSSPLIAINSCAELVMLNDTDIFHHSIEEDVDGNIWIASYKFPYSLPSKYVGDSFENFYDDSLVKISPEGKVIFEKPISEIFIENGLEYLLFAVGNSEFNIDPIHINDIQPVLEDSDYWKKGDLFLSIRNQSMIILYRPSTNKIIWRDQGNFFYQHDIDILDDHRISLFNNNTKNLFNGTFVDGLSSVLIYDFKTLEYKPYLENSFKINDIYSITGGRSEILPNGDLFVEESNFARTLYFNSDGSLRWIHLNKSTNGDPYLINWSRILYTKKDINKVKKFLNNRAKCNEK
jgi:hypothetical protein